MSSSFWVGKTVLITGASSGIGLELTSQILKKGGQVAMLARRLDSMNAFYNTLPASLQQCCLVLQGDVTQPESLEAARKQIIERFKKVDVVLANAGFAVNGRVQDLNYADFKRQFDTNVDGVVHTFYVFKEELIKNKGVFSVTGSIAGHLGLATLGTYCASKFAVRGWCESLEGDLAHLGVRVVHFSCGFIESEILIKNNEGKIRPGAKSRAPKSLVVPTPVAVKEMIWALERKSGDVRITNHAKCLVFAKRIYENFPRFLQRFVR